MQERNSLLEELLRKRENFNDISSDMQILEAERARLSLLEEKIKEVLVMLRALNSTVSKFTATYIIIWIDVVTLPLHDLYIQKSYA